MINSYRFGQIDVDGKVYTSDIIILPEGIRANWWRKTGHELCTDDITDVLNARPELLIVGTGASGLMRVLPEVEKTLSGAGIKLIVKRTQEACDLFNGLPPDKKAAAALHLTC
jgi:hypothetical protein